MLNFLSFAAARAFHCLLGLLAGGFFVGVALPAESVPLAELGMPGRILMLRHANAPGTGDPPNFRLGDCATQRNLDAGGRAQAQTLGKHLAQAGITRAAVYSSQWCRCLETARLLKLGSVQTLTSLNSFYHRDADRETNLAALRSFLAALPSNGLPVVLVTHQLTINAFTAGGTPSGGGSIFQLNGSGAPHLLGAVRVD